MFVSSKIMRSIIVIAAAASVFSAVAGYADDIGLQVQTQGQARYISGGIGFGEREALKAIAAREKMNLKLVFAERSRAYLSAVPVTIKDSAGTVVLKVTTDGPWLFVHLPAGEYRYHAARDEETTDGSQDRRTAPGDPNISTLRRNRSRCCAAVF